MERSRYKAPQNRRREADTSIVKKATPQKTPEDETGEQEVQKKLAEAESNMKVNSTTHRKMWMKFLRFRKNKKMMRLCPAQMVAALQSEAWGDFRVTTIASQFPQRKT